MTLPLSGNISLNDIIVEFSGPTTSGLTDYYRGATYVPDTATNSGVPTSGAIAITDFYGASDAEGTPEPDVGYINNGVIELLDSQLNMSASVTNLSEFGIGSVRTISFNVSDDEDAALILQTDGSLDYLDMNDEDITNWSSVGRTSIPYTISNIDYIDSVAFDIHLVPGSSASDYEVSSYHTGTDTEITSSLSSSWIAEGVAIDTSTSPVTYILGRGQGDSTGNKYKRFNIAGTNTGNFGGTGFATKIVVEPGASGRFVGIESGDAVLRNSSGTTIQTLYSTPDQVRDTAYDFSGSFFALVTRHSSLDQGVLQVYNTGETYTLIDEIEFDTEGDHILPSNNLEQRSIAWSKDSGGTSRRLLVTNAVFDVSESTVTLVDYITSFTETGPYNPFFYTKILV